MNLKYLIPTLKCACTSALIEHDHGTLSKDSALAVAFDPNGDPHVLFIHSVTDEMKCPSYVIFCCVILGAGLTTFTDTIAGLNLNTEHSVSRMSYTILSLLPTRLYEIQAADERILNLAGILSDHAVNGITGGIAAEKTPANKPTLAVGGHPERN